jgi:hypothetical protein
VSEHVHAILSVVGNFGGPDRRLPDFGVETAAPNRLAVTCRRVQRDRDRVIVDGGSGLAQGRVIGTGAYRLAWSESRAATGSGNGTSRSLPPFGGAKIMVRRTILICRTACKTRRSVSMSSLTSVGLVART